MQQCVKGLIALRDQESWRSKVLQLANLGRTHLLVHLVAALLPGRPHAHPQDEDVEQDHGADPRNVDHLA